MAGDNANLRVWSGADVRLAPLGSTTPTTLTEDWDAAFELVGLLSEDAGMEEGRNSTKKDIFTYGGGLGRTVNNKFKPTFKFTPAEYNDLVNEAMNPGREVTAGSGIVTIDSAVPTLYTVEWMVGLELADGDTVKRRIYWKVKFDPDGTESLKDDELDAPEITANIFPVEMTVNGNTKQFWKRDITNAAGIVGGGS